MNPPYLPLNQLYLFPRHQTREDYERTMVRPCPPWNPSRRPKYWEHPAALLSPRRSVVYNQTLVTADNGNAIPGEDGKPQLDMLVLLKEEAAAINIPPGLTDVPGADQPEVPFPLRPLEPNEELVFGFGGVVRVKDNSSPHWEEVKGFTAEDREYLHAIGRAVGLKA